MLEFLSGLLSVWLNMGEVETLKPTDLANWLESTTAAVASEAEAAPDPAVEAIVQQHLRAVAAVGMTTDRQGVWVQVGNQVVAAHQGSTPLSAASLTKIATTLAALGTWGINHQFTTLVGGTTVAEAGVLNGDLIVQGGGDPLFVWEEAIALANALQQAGITRVTGNLVIAGDFLMNFEPDAAKAGTLLKQGMNADLWNAEVAAQFAKLPAGTARPRLQIDGAVQVVTMTEAQNRMSEQLVRHQSLPLPQVLKAMNSYSNNVIAETLAEAIGGANVVSEKAAAIAQVPASEIQLINGSGLGNQNRISPRAVTAMLLAIQRYLQPLDRNVGDLFSVMGQTWGVLRNRQIPNNAVVKSGTLDDVSSLAGVLPTRDRGLVWFAIINVGTADLDGLHNQQDLLLQRLQQQWGTTSAPATIRPGTQDSQTSNQFGAADRNEIL